MKREYTLRVAGLTRQLKLYPISDALQIAAFILLGDAELTEACARASSWPRRPCSIHSTAFTAFSPDRAGAERVVLRR